MSTERTKDKVELLEIPNPNSGANEWYVHGSTLAQRTRERNHFLKRLHGAKALAYRLGFHRHVTDYEAKIHRVRALQDADRKLTQQARDIAAAQAKEAKESSCE